MNIFSFLNLLSNKKGIEPFCKTAFSQEPSLDNAVEQVCLDLKNSSNCDIAIVFISTNFSSDFTRLLPLLKRRLKATIWLGCAGGGVIGMNQNGLFCESLNKTSLSITLLNLPDTELVPFHITEDSEFDLDNPSKIWSKYLKIENLQNSSALIFIDPSMPNTNDLISTFDFSFPQSNLIGGIAGYHSSSHGSLFFENQVSKGAVGIIIKGAWKVQTLVTKGVKPIGPVLEVESVQKNVLLKLRNNEKSASPVEFLQELINELSESERNLLKQSLFLGVENKNLKITNNGKLLSDGTFVVRDLIGIDPSRGAVAVKDLLKVGQKVQFQSRDIDVSRSEVAMGLEKLINELPDKPLLTILLTCLGRSKAFYGDYPGDLDAAKIFIGPSPLCGAFFQGEIGQINGNTHLHGYSACWGLIVRNNEK